MAQGTSTPFGFRPYRHLTGGNPNSTHDFPIASAYATAICTGDAVKLLSDGTIAVAAAGDRVLGVFQGVSYVDSNGNQVFTARWPASTVATAILASVITDPMVTFEVQSDKATAPDQTDVGLLADHVATAGSSVTGSSGHSLSPTQGTGVAGFRILKLIPKVGNTGIYATVEVSIVEHEYLPVFSGTPGV